MEKKRKINYSMKRMISEKKLTIRKLSQMIGISENALASKIRGYNYFNENEIEKICEVFNVQVEELFFQKDSRLNARA